MKKFFFFYNHYEINPIIFNKLILKFLPIKYLLRFRKEKTNFFFIVDTFSIFFQCKVKTFSHLKNSFFNKKIVKNLWMLRRELKKIDIGTTINFNCLNYKGKNQLNFSFFFFRQKKAQKKLSFFLNELTQLYLLNILNLQIKLIFFPCRKIMKGFAKYKYFLHDLQFFLKRKPKNVFLGQTKLTKAYKFFFKKPLVFKQLDFKFFLKTQKYFSLLPPVLTDISTLPFLYRRKVQLTRKFFSLKKHRKSIFLKQKRKLFFFKQHRKFAMSVWNLLRLTTNKGINYL